MLRVGTAHRASKYTRHRKKAEEVWLVININNGIQLSTMFQLKDESLDAVYESSFERVFILAHNPQRLHELKVVAPVARGSMNYNKDKARTKQ